MDKDSAQKKECLEMIGRENEQKSLLKAFNFHESQFVAVYGRRRVGKTYLVRKTFGDRFAFYHTGIYDKDYREQLAAFKDSLEEYGLADCPTLKNWREAFKELRRLLAGKPEGRKVVFIDELPWMETRGSRFVTQLDLFWNKWASAREDIVLVVCGSAASWMIKNLIDSRGGLHDRLTDRIVVHPFTLRECEAYSKELGLSMSRREIAECYMVFGGIPYYWGYLERGKSVAQNVDDLLFSKDGKLHKEFERLFKSLFGVDALYQAVISALALKKSGMTREEILSTAHVPDNGHLTVCLAALEECGFLRSYEAVGKTKKAALFQLIDNFTLFHHRFLSGETQTDERFWSETVSSSLQSVWKGLAFERLCLQHVFAIKRKLGISGVRTLVNSWSCKANAHVPKGAQIDLLIDRADGVINICEMKYSQGIYPLERTEMDRLINRRAAFIAATGTRKSVHFTMVTPDGLADTPERFEIQSEVTLDDLFQ